MSTPQEFQRVSAELTQLRTQVAALADEWEREGREADGYVNRAHHSEIHEVMTEARLFPRVAAELRAVLEES